VYVLVLLVEVSGSTLYVLVQSLGWEYFSQCHVPLSLGIPATLLTPLLQLLLRGDLLVELQLILLSMALALVPLSVADLCR
jgi:hypothetical protein